ncbi:MAG: hypothetical protein ACI93R_002214 [Flavobacteriales bacterium]|jgi:hypothetical protein
MANQGGCLCGGIRFEIQKFIEGGIGHCHCHCHCHCQMCRKFHGAEYATIASIKRSDFKWLCGEELLNHYRAENKTTRSFCRNCGSSLVFHSDNFGDANNQDTSIEIALGCVEGDI